MSSLRSTDRKRRYALVVVISIIFISSIFITGLLILQDPKQQALATLDSNIANVMDDQHIPGVAACAVKNGSVIWMETYGLADIDQNISVTPDTIFMLGSLSKIVTGIAFMHLYENGLIDLDDDINDYLVFDVVHPDHPETAITPRMLLSHVSGIRDNWLILGPLEVSGMDSPLSLEEFTQNYLTSNGSYYSAANFNDGEPGTEYEYTNVGSTLIAYLVEVISNATFEDYCQQNIFLPLNMNETSWFLENLDEDMMAMPYLYTSSGFSPYGHYSSAVYPCGFMRTSIHQEIQLLTVLMEGGSIGDTEILSNSTLQLMMTLHYPSISSNYGFYFQKSGVLWGHGGSGPGVTTRMFFYPEAHEGVIIMMNLENHVAIDSIHNHILVCMRTAFDWLT
ncbi:class A beta-lactamase-related serine hydrolase [Candidatus Thorarchaeota archaeon]|nr:MAG: class A beta-lactamase-related serine hydrolase [Candidatus Thorarchaeota archaeon]